jgi:hypothetical protein
MEVSGHSVPLPGRVPLPSTWGEPREHYHGPAKLKLGELGPIADICERPGLKVTLSVSCSTGDIDTMTAANIPATAAIRSVFTYPTDRTGSC